MLLSEGSALKICFHDIVSCFKLGCAANQMLNSKLYTHAHYNFKNQETPLFMSIALNFAFPYCCI